MTKSTYRLFVLFTAALPRYLCIQLPYPYRNLMQGISGQSIGDSRSVIVEGMLSDVGAENVSNLPGYNAITHSTSTLSNTLLRKKI